MCCRQQGRNKALDGIRTLGENEAKKMFMNQILSKPINNLKMSLLFGWRGLHYVFIFVPFFAIVISRALRHDHSRHLILIFSITLFNFIFHSLFTHFNVRYGYPMLASLAPSCAIFLASFSREKK